MHAGPRDVAQIRLDNALALFDEFVHATVKHPDAATLRGLERRFAERLQIQPSYWSQIKGRSRQIGERLARQFEQLCHKPYGWMDEPHDAFAPPSPTPARATDDDAHHSLPRDDDERFIVGLVLTYYRRHPERARTRLLDLLGEVLAPAAMPAPRVPAAPSGAAKPAPGAPRAPVPPPGAAGSVPKRGTGSAAPPASSDESSELWHRMQAGIAPLKRKK